jgi:hypothetical protein
LKATCLLACAAADLVGTAKAAPLPAARATTVAALLLVDAGTLEDVDLDEVVLIDDDEEEEEALDDEEEEEEALLEEDEEALELELELVEIAKTGEANAEDEELAVGLPTGTPSPALMESIRLLYDVVVTMGATTEGFGNAATEPPFHLATVSSPMRCKVAPPRFTCTKRWWFCFRRPSCD